MAAVPPARSYTDDVQFSAEDATRSDPASSGRSIEAVIQSGATTINLPDTVGYSTPDEIAEFFRRHRPRAELDRSIFSTHCHDDLGLAVANTLAALRAARARSSARSTASASAPATRRSRRS
jgi:2-isopropylmalate synthase